MKNKIKFIFIVAIFLLGTFAFADYGVGGQYGFNAGPYYDNFVSGTARSDQSPWCIGVNAWPWSNLISVTADNWFINKKFEKIVDWYAFWGISATLTWNDFSIGTGARLGVGLDWFVLDKRQLELFCQACWNPYIGVEHSGSWGAMIRPLNFPLSTGARWWFR